MTRQRLHQLRNIAKGMCVNHTDRPIEKGNRCAECRAKWNEYQKKRKYMLMHGE